MTHWANAYIGKPWVAGGRGPDAFDCYGLAVAVQAAHFGRTMPLVKVDAADRRAAAAALGSPGYRSGWTPVDAAARADGDLVLMAHARHPSHVGIWLAVDGGGILHCASGAGVVFSRIPVLRQAGWGHLEYFHPDEPTHD